MLALTRKLQEGIVIRTPEGREITIKILEIRHDRVRLGLHADEDVTINRDSIQRMIDRKHEGRRP